MSATAAMEIGGDLWNARVYAGLSLASELAAVLDTPKPVTFSLLGAWRVYSQLGKLNRDVDEILKEYDRPVPFPPVVPSERIRVGRDILLQLHSDCGRLLSLRDRIPLRRLIGKRLGRLQNSSERILDLADWFDAMSTPDEIEAKFGAARAELAKGEVVPWSAVG